MVAKVIQERLQGLTEDELPESQCGYRKGQGCTDTCITFTVHQLVKTSWEHKAKIFITFIDLKRHPILFHVVPCGLLWES